MNYEEAKIAGFPDQWLSERFTESTGRLKFFYWHWWFTRHHGYTTLSIPIGVTTGWVLANIIFG